jgi:hypothetical protein
MDKHTPPSSSSSSSSVTELTDILDKNETAIKTSVKRLITRKFKEDKTSIFENSKNSDK